MAPWPSVFSQRASRKLLPDRPCKQKIPPTSGREVCPDVAGIRLDSVKESGHDFLEGSLELLHFLRQTNGHADIGGPCRPNTSDVDLFLRHGGHDFTARPF